MKGILYAITFARVFYEPDGTVRSVSSGVSGIFDSFEDAANHINKEFAEFDEHGMRTGRFSSYNKLISSSQKSCGAVTWTEFVEDTPIMAGVHTTTHFRLADLYLSHVPTGQ